MRFIKYIFILSFCFPTLVLSATSVDVCSVSFLKHEEFIKSFFSDPKNINQYQGQKGHIKFVEEYLSFLKMNTVFIYTSKVLSKEDMNILNWKIYSGNTKAFRKERLQILDETGNVKEEYQGPKGYVRYADDFYVGKMLQAYKNISAVLSESEKKSLNWQQYQGSTKEFRRERFQILDETGNVKEEYQGQFGYASYADDFYVKKYQGQVGYDRYADEFYVGKMLQAYKNVSAVLSESEKNSLNWQIYQGNTKEFRKERSNILDKTGKVKKEYQGLKGYVRYADEFYLGKMLKAYQNVSVVLSKEDMKYLGWKQFAGDTNQFRSLFEFFKHHSFEDYKGPLGQKKIAKMIFKNHLKNTYLSISALRDYLFSHKDEFKDLRKSGWSRTLSW